MFSRSSTSLKGYFQVPVHPDDIPKTVIITPFGTYVFHYTIFGLRNSGATFRYDESDFRRPVILPRLRRRRRTTTPNTYAASYSSFKTTASSFARTSVFLVSLQSSSLATRSMPTASVNFTRKSPSHRFPAPNHRQRRAGIPRDD